MTLAFYPVTPDRWPELDRLFSGGEEGGAGNPSRCWCMEWRRPRAEWEAEQGESNRRALERFIAEGNVPGILAYDGGDPVGWCSISPRATLPTLKARGQFRDFENPAVWSVVCFYIRDGHRGRGVMDGLLRAAVDYAAGRGAGIVEGYPADPDAMSAQALNMARFMGRLSAFRDAGFTEVARGPDGRPVVRYTVEERRRP